MSGYGARGGPKKAPNRIVTVPLEMRPRQILVDLERVANQEWEAETKVRIVPIFQMGRLKQFELYGAAVNLDGAVKVINKWLEDASRKAPKSVAWSKQKAFDYNNWYYDEVRKMEYERKQSFKKPIPEEEIGKVPYMTLVDWPDELLELEPKVTPRDAFGNKLEALDQMRMDEEVYITLHQVPNRTAAWQVEIRGYEQEHVESAEICFQNLIQKIYQKSLVGNEDTVTNLILDEAEGCTVTLKAADTWWPPQPVKVVPKLIYSPMMNDPGTFRMNGVHQRDVADLRGAIRRALERIRYERGSYDFTVRFGCLALKGLTDSDIGKTYPLTGFKRSTEGGSAVECRVLKWLLSSDVGDQMLDRMMRADHLLGPVRSGDFGYTPPTLKDTKPTYRCTFVLHDPDKSQVQKPRSFTNFRNPARPSPNGPNPEKATPPELNLIIVQVEWTEDEDGEYEKMPPVFFRLKPNQAGPTENMDINLLELGESRAWAFSLESMIPIPKTTLSKSVINFADLIKMRRGYKSNSKEPFATFSLSPSIKMNFCRLDRVYTFGIRKTLYRVEAKESWYPQQKTPCWSLVIRHTEWPMLLSPLERISHGHGADFGKDPVRTFIPDDGMSSSAHDDVDIDIEDRIRQMPLGNGQTDGMVVLTEKMMQLSKIVNDTVNDTADPSNQSWSTSGLKKKR